MSDITLASTTDSVEDVQLALAVTPTPVEPLKTEGSKPITDIVPAKTPDEPVTPDTDTDDTDTDSADADPDTSADPVDEDVVDTDPDTTPVIPPVKSKGGFQKKIDKLTAAAHTKDQEIEALRRQLVEKVTTPATVKSDDAPKPLTLKPAPKLADCATYDEWIEKTAVWQEDGLKVIQQSADDRAKALETKAEQAKQTEINERTNQQKQAALVSRIEQGRTAHQDFDAVVLQNESVFISDVVRNLAINRADGHEILYWLGSHPDEAEQLMSLAPIDQVMEIGAIAKTLKPAKPAPVPVKPIVKKSAAPKPAAKVGPSKPVSGKKDSSYWDNPNVSQAEYNAWRAETSTRK